MVFTLFAFAVWLERQMALLVDFRQSSQHPKTRWMRYGLKYLSVWWTVHCTVSVSVSRTPCRRHGIVLSTNGIRSQYGVVLRRVTQLSKSCKIRADAASVSITQIIWARVKCNMTVLTGVLQCTRITGVYTERKSFPFILLYLCFSSFDYILTDLFSLFLFVLIKKINCFLSFSLSFSRITFFSYLAGRLPILSSSFCRVYLLFAFHLFRSIHIIHRGFLFCTLLAFSFHFTLFSPLDLLRCYSAIIIVHSFSCPHFWRFFH